MDANESIREKYRIIGEIGVEKNKFGKYCTYLMAIEKLIDKNQPTIPTVWLKKLLSYFTDVGKLEQEYFENKNKEKIDTHTQDAISYFANHKEYQFNGEYEYRLPFNFDFSFLSDVGIYPPSPAMAEAVRRRKKKRVSAPPVEVKPNMRPYSLHTLLRYCISAYFALEEPKETKEQAILFFLKEIEIFIAKYFNQTDKDAFKKPYKKQVIAGYLTMKIAGYRLSQKVYNKFTNPNIYEATRNALRPKKKKD